ncbi:MAG: hypothetical protein GXY25_17825 [Pirellulaceae bacterium]|jgi:hypothetical protein|nr:hypothetical protein [Thermoguttaceae bacterium]MDI9443213.1 hypothetical protein [Planctomycetota bacterium]NLZ02379.1 hypothetical protein [Pirellulaceae bacterium]
MRSRGLRIVVGSAAVALSLAAGAAAIAAEQERASVSRAELPYLAQIEQSLDAVERADIGTAVDALQWTGEASSKLKQQLAGAATSLGKSDGHELIGVRRFSPRLHQIYGAIHYEKQPLMFVLHPRLFNGQWRIQTVTFTVDLKGLDSLAPLERIAPEPGDRVAARGEFQDGYARTESGKLKTEN